MVQLTQTLSNFTVDCLKPSTHRPNVELWQKLAIRLASVNGAWPKKVCGSAPSQTGVFWRDWPSPCQNTIAWQGRLLSVFFFPLSTTNCLRKLLSGISWHVQQLQLCCEVLLAREPGIRSCQVSHFIETVRWLLSVRNNIKESHGCLHSS